MENQKCKNDIKKEKEKKALTCCNYTMYGRSYIM